MTKQTKLHELALQIVRAHKWEDNARSSENRRVMAEAKLHNYSPNEVANYVLEMFDTLNKELNIGTGDDVPELNTRSKFNDAFFKDHPGVEPTSSEYLMALHEHAKSVRNFDWHN